MDTPNASARGAVRRMVAFLRRYGIAIWLALLPLLIALLLVRRHEEIGRVVGALRSADPAWLVVAGGVQVFVVLATALTYRVILSRLGHRLPSALLARAHLQRVFVGTVTPISGPASVYSFVHTLGRRRVTAEDALTTVALRAVAGHGAFWLMLLAALALRGALALLLILGAVVGAGALLVQAVRGRALPRAWGPHGWRRRLPAGASRRVVETLGRFRRHRIAWRDLAPPLALSVAVRLGGIALLLVSLRALGAEATLGVAIAAYCTAMLASAAVPFFHGAGVVEAATAVALRHAGVPPDVAIAATLLWRLFEFWLPLAVGGLLQAAGLFRPALAPVVGPAETKAAVEAA